MIFKSNLYCLALSCILFILIFSCGGVSDVYKNIGNGYYYISNGPTNKKILFKQANLPDSLIIKPTVVSYKYNENYITALQEYSIQEEAYILSQELSSISYGFKMFDQNDTPKINTYYQKLMENDAIESTFYRNINSRISNNNSYQDQLIFKKIADSLVRIKPEFENFKDGDAIYWIIVKNTTKRYGPLKRDQFLELIRELNIPKDLVI